MSGRCHCSSATSPTRFTKACASLKSSNLYSLRRWCSFTTSQSSSWACNFFISSVGNGGTPPRQGTHLRLASSFILRPPKTPSSISQFVPHDKDCAELLHEASHKPVELIDDSFDLSHDDLSFNSTSVSSAKVSISARKFSRSI